MRTLRELSGEQNILECYKICAACLGIGRNQSILYQLPTMELPL